MNRLAGEKSAYLRHAAGQKVEWYPWSEEAFEKAKKEDKPLFLSSGAVWCHWCHVMAKECFKDEEVVRLLNENFINIKLDRDERPDIDRRYQQAVAAMGFGGGWPLSVFLTPDKRPFFGGTYFPPEDMHGRPGMKKILKAVSKLYRSKRDEVSEYTTRLVNSLKPAAVSVGEIDKAIIESSVKKIISELDSENGGFGTAPKFPMPGAIEFLMNRFFLTQDETIKIAVQKTLKSMAGGGFHDQIGGGFHRYSTDEAWIVPHFEKMADDNAWLLRNYLSAYSLFNDRYFKEAALGTINFIRHVLSDPEGGFYANQDADVTPDDEGGYFTWREEDFRSLLNDDEYRVLSLHLFDNRGSMHHDKSKKVLFIVNTADEVAKKLGMGIDSVTEIIRRGKEKLIDERKRRKSPFIDKTLYTSLNGMLISAFLQGFKSLKEASLREFALKSLKRIMDIRFIDNKLYHTEGVKAFLDDYIHLTDALISAYEVTGRADYLNRSDEIMTLCIKKLWDSDEGGFFDAEDHLLDISIKGVDDIPCPSANSLAIRLLVRLSFMTEDKRYYRYAEKALKCFSSMAKGSGTHAGYLFSAFDEYFNTLKLTLNADPESDLAKEALTAFHPYKSIVYREDKGMVLPCIKDICYEPVYTTEHLREFLKKAYLL